MTTTARGSKSQAAFRTISEVADELDVAQHVLRFWESKFPQVRPLKRGGGRRYYRPEDIELLRDIRSLLYDEGYTIKGAQKLLRQRRAKPPAAARPAEATPPQADSEGTDPDPPAPRSPTAKAPLPRPAPTLAAPVADPPAPAAQPAPSLAPTTPTPSPTPGAARQAASPAGDVEKLERLRAELYELRRAVAAALAAADS